MRSEQKSGKEKQFTFQMETIGNVFCKHAAKQETGNIFTCDRSVDIVAMHREVTLKNMLSRHHSQLDLKGV